MITILLFYQGELKMNIYQHYHGRNKCYQFYNMWFKKYWIFKKILPYDIDLIIHCAAKIKIYPDGRYSDNLVEDNLISTINLIEAMIEKGIKNIVLCSSVTVYGVENNIPINENGILKPINFYGFTKKWAEEAIINYSRKKFLNALILRLPGLYGYTRTSGYI